MVQRRKVGFFERLANRIIDVGIAVTLGILLLWVLIDLNSHHWVRPSH